LADDITDVGFVESTPKQDGRNMVMVIAPVKKGSKPKPKKASTEAEQAERGNDAKD
jgi:translation initiation factor IF-3